MPEDKIIVLNFYHHSNKYLHLCIEPDIAFLSSVKLYTTLSLPSDLSKDVNLPFCKTVTPLPSKYQTKFFRFCLYKRYEYNCYQC